ncbi:nucleoside-diphosphate-sugar epimerase [Pedobacter cryoconitis]|uniref:NAD-dependent epimerase/dehydratase family protein n=1 Tax=Pedobacter cryoconitis TaxID=188932 RepID=UPI00161F9E71|nr:NAD(P)-dependent oxidoreductase [Pedobacter cryoconitis]MBB6270365.1 nucleoside-diphosphate-sugar epimerase [Pedobacter cryoconitis]
MKKRVLITGASGFVGYHLITAAISSGLEVFAAVRSSSNVKHLEEFDIQYTNPDFSNIDLLKKELEEKQYNYIIHASGITKAKTQEEYNKINAEYTRNLASAAVEANISLEKFIFVSSLAALGPLNDLSGLIEDNSPAHPVTNYGASKLLAEQYLAEINHLPLIVIRPTAVYGPREKDIFILLQTINKGLEPHIGSFKQQISFIYVKDLAKIIIDALFSEVTNRHYNVSDGGIYDRYALAEGVKKAMHKRTWKFHLPVSAVAVLAALMERIYKNSAAAPALNKEKMNELTAINWACSIEKLKTDLGFKPAYNLENGLLETVNWYRNNKWL